MRALRVARMLVVLLTVLALCGTRSHAQTGQAAVTGQITDQAERMVPSVKVVFTNLNTNTSYSTVTNSDGIYNLPALPPGIYRANVTKDGFKSIVKGEIELHTQDNVSLNFALQVGSVSETITVSANREHIETDNPAVGLLVDRTFVENTPLNGRSFQDLIALAPGAVTSPAAGGGSGLFSINGQREDANYFTVDGVGANLNPQPGNLPGSQFAGTIPSQTALGTTQSLVSVDALQEFKIQTSGYTAEYGRQPGGQVELTTRSGSNDIHGSLFDYFRNEALDANSWFNNDNHIPKQAERQNDFGGTIGGPLEIPKVYNGRDRTFYFVSYEGLRLIQPNSSGIIDVPSLAFRQFAATSVQPILNSLPVPNGPENGDQCAASLGYTFSCTAQWSAGYSDPSRFDSISARLDEIVSPRFQIFVRYADTPSEASSHFGGSQLNRFTTNSHLWTVGSSLKLTSSVIDELRFNFTASRGDFLSFPVAIGGAIPYPRDLIVPTAYAPAGAPAFGGVFLSLQGSNQINVPQYSSSINQLKQYDVVDSLTWAKGGHALKFGGDYRRVPTLYEPTPYGVSFLLASLPEVQQGFASEAFVSAEQVAHPVFNNFSVYAQDSWKIRSALTLEYGLRWEFNPAPGASDGLYPLALTTGNLSLAQVAPPGTAQYKTTYRNFAPRLGFAYDAFRSGPLSLVLRGGFGIFYDTGQNLGAAGYGGYPFSNFEQLSNIPLPASAPNLVPPPLNVPLVPPYGFINGISDPNLRLPYTEEWNISVDKQLSSRNTLSLSYVGNVGRRLLFTGQYGQFGIPYPTNPNFTNFNFTSNASSSSYNGFQAQDQGYVAPGLRLIASYTFAHALDNASDDTSTYAPLRGNSNYDVRHVLNAAVNYEIPLESPYRIVRLLTQGWSVDSRISVQSGYPLEVFQGFYTLPDGIQSFIRPDLVPGVAIYLHDVAGALGGWALNPLAFNAVPTDPVTGVPLRIGTLGRNYVRGPGFWNLNFAIQKNFPLSERFRLLFRTEAFNIFNHPNPGEIQTCLCSSPFGQSTGATATLGVPTPLYATGSPRSLQIALKLQF